MPKKAKKYIAGFCMVFSVIFFFTGCWDSRELDSIFIVTAVGIDIGEEPETAKLTLEVGQTGSKKESGEDSSKKGSSLVLQSSAKTVGESVNEIDRNSSRTLLFPHNQVLLFGSDIAKQGIEAWLDPLMRNQEGRLEVLLMVSDGSAGDIVSEKMDQEDITGMYIARMMQDMDGVSPYYNIRMLDFIAALRTKITSPVAPLIQMEDTDNGKTLRIAGLAVFKEDKMVGKLSMDQFASYVWTMGKVERCSVIAKEDKLQANLNIARLSSKQDIILTEDNQVEVKIKVEAFLSIAELHGFTGVSKKDLMPILKKMAENQIKTQILDTFKTAQQLQADIYGIGTKLSKKSHQQWEEIKDDWDTIFASLNPDISVNANIMATGQIMDSLEMKEEKNED